MVSPELLRRYPFFAGLSEEQLKSIAMIAEEEDYETDDFIFEQGEESDALFVITEGEVAILINVDDEGEEQEELTALPAGSMLAWSALVPPYTLTASGVANTTPTKVLAIDAEELRELFDEDCGLGYLILQQVVKVMRERMSQTRTQLASLSPC
ncbi:MAG: Crp/Fnr family transcriptional regulator [Anaerolineae bacterium]|nr:Crp/Fnr family transcriptional regulator [Anaerolineae bacterium]